MRSLHSGFLRLLSVRARVTSLPNVPVHERQRTVDWTLLHFFLRQWIRLPLLTSWQCLFKLQQALRFIRLPMYLTHPVEDRDDANVTW